MSDDPGEVRTCGRPTRSRKPCRRQLWGRDIACEIRATEQDRALAGAYERGYDLGFQCGRESEKHSDQAHIEYLERRVKDLQQRLDRATRIHEVDGDQVVEAGGYAYRWHGDPPLQVGDRVLLPENWVSKARHGPGPLQEVVTALGTTYQGALTRIICRIAPKEP